MDWLLRFLRLGEYSLSRTLGAARSSQWPTTRRNHLRKHPFCEITGSFKDVEVHHVKNFKDHPELENDPDNLITLTREMHFHFAHLRDWSSINPHIREDARVWRDKIRLRS